LALKASISLCLSAALRAKRAMENAERKAREKEKQEATKMAVLNKDLMEARR